LIPQDIEEVLGGKKTTTSENIDALVASYKSSVHMDKVTRQIADICGTVSRPPFTYILKLLVGVLNFANFMCVCGLSCGFREGRW
jgi:hypothetical protein